jgi:uncharacterized phage protein gp47/JayE
VDYGITPKGFRRKSYDEILADMEANARNLFGNDIDLSETSSFGQRLRIMAYALAEKWNEAEKVYNSGYVDTAEGLQLNRVGKYIGIEKRAASKAGTKLLLSGEIGKQVLAGFKGSTPTGIEFETLSDVTVGGDGTILTTVKAVNAGISGNVAANTITVIVNPIAGITSITNPNPATGGQDEESDAEFRERYSISVAKGGSSTADSIRAKLLDEVPGVRAAIVFENDTSTVDSAGRPPKCIECVVLGGNQTNIANAILASKAGGIQAYGTTSVVVQDSSGKDKTIGFTYAGQKLIYVNAEITKTPAYPLDGDSLIQLAIIKYIGGADGSGNVYAGLSMGESVIYNAIIGEIYKIPGVKNLVLEIGTNGIDFDMLDIPVDEIEVTETDADAVVVTSHV